MRTFLLEPAERGGLCHEPHGDEPVIGEPQAASVGAGQLAPLGREPAWRLGDLEPPREHVVYRGGGGWLAQAEALLEQDERLRVGRGTKVEVAPEDERVVAGPVPRD